MNRRAVLSGAGLAVSSTLAGCATLLSDEPPVLTVENQDDTEYRLTAHSVLNIDKSTETVTFRATTESGDRRYVDGTQLQSGAPYWNVTLAEDNVQRQKLTIPPSGSTSTTVDVWEPEAVTAYLIETTNGDKFSIGIKVVTCEDNGQEHQITISDELLSQWSATC